MQDVPSNLYVSICFCGLTGNGTVGTRSIWLYYPGHPNSERVQTVSAESERATTDPYLTSHRVPCRNRTADELLSLSHNNSKEACGQAIVTLFIQQVDSSCNRARTSSVFRNSMIRRGLSHFVDNLAHRLAKWEAPNIGSIHRLPAPALDSRRGARLWHLSGGEY